MGKRIDAAKAWTSRQYERHGSHALQVAALAGTFGINYYFGGKSLKSLFDRRAFGVGMAAACLSTALPQIVKSKHLEIQGRHNLFERYRLLTHNAVALAAVATLLAKPAYGVMATNAGLSFIATDIVLRHRFDKDPKN